MKEFWIYTLLRLVMFLSSLGIVVGIWLKAAGEVPLLWAVVIAFILSGIGSYFLLNRPREALARKVEARASRVASRFEERKAKEDDD